MGSAQPFTGIRVETRDGRAVLTMVVADVDQTWIAFDETGIREIIRELTAKLPKKPRRARQPKA